MTFAVYRIGLKALVDGEPRFVAIPESDRPVVQMPLGGLGKYYEMAVENMGVVSARILDPLGEPVAVHGVTGVRSLVGPRVSIKGDRVRVRGVIPVNAATPAIDPTLEGGFTLTLKDRDGEIYAVTIPELRWQDQTPLGSRWTYDDPGGVLGGVRKAAIKRVGKGGAYEIPPGTDLREITRRLGPAPNTHHGSVLVRTGTCLGMRRHATGEETGVTGPDGTSAWDRLTVAYGTVASFAEEVMSYGADACVEAPEDVRAMVVRRLAGALERIRGVASPGREACDPFQVDHRLLARVVNHRQAEGLWEWLAVSSATYDAIRGLGYRGVRIDLAGHRLMED